MAESTAPRSRPARQTRTQAAPGGPLAQARAYVRRNWLWLLTSAGALLPLLWLLWDWWFDNLSIDPLDDFTNRTGSAAIILLLVSLAVTPINTITGWRQVLTLRKTLGLYAFFYAALHLLVFVGLDYGFSLEFILLDGLPSKPYIVVGLAAFLILLPLAITSTRGSMKRLGRNWKRLHRLVYVAGILAVVHYLWVAKVAVGLPVVYTAILALLLVARIPVVRTWLSRQRGRIFGTPKPSGKAAVARLPKEVVEA
jgi:sulfoxide reductase heme-binding subunit YedZ